MPKPRRRQANRAPVGCAPRGLSPPLESSSAGASCSPATRRPTARGWIYVTQACARVACHHQRFAGAGPTIENTTSSMPSRPFCLTVVSVRPTCFHPIGLAFQTARPVTTYQRFLVIILRAFAPMTVIVAVNPPAELTAIRIQFELCEGVLARFYALRRALELRSRVKSFSLLPAPIAKPRIGYALFEIECFHKEGWRQRLLDVDLPVENRGA